MTLHENTAASLAPRPEHIAHYREKNRLFINYLVAFLSMPLVLNIYNFLFMRWSDLQAQTSNLLISMHGGLHPNALPSLRPWLADFINPRFAHILLPVLALVVSGMALSYVAGASPLIRTEVLRKHLYVQESLIRRFMTIMFVIVLVSLIPTLSGFGLDLQHPFHARPYTLIWASVAQIACFYYSLKFLFRFIVGMHLLNEPEVKAPRYRMGALWLTIATLEFVVFIGLPVWFILYNTSAAVAH